MKLTRPTKLEIALRQLQHALFLYKRREELICAVTLAGAAEEILGKLCRERGKTASLDRKLKSTAELHEYIWGEKPQSEKALRSFKNRTRNEFKHLMSGKPIDVNLENSAADLIARAIENYRLLSGKETQEMRVFQRDRLRAYQMRGS